MDIDLYQYKGRRMQSSTKEVDRGLRPCSQDSGYDNVTYASI